MDTLRVSLLALVGVMRFDSPSSCCLLVVEGCARPARLPACRHPSSYPILSSPLHVLAMIMVISLSLFALTIFFSIPILFDLPHC
jgi:hypothetical protein